MLAHRLHTVRPLVLVDLTVHYTGNSGIPFNELKTAFNASSPYAASKYQGEVSSSGCVVWLLSIMLAGANADLEHHVWATNSRAPLFHGA